MNRRSFLLLQVVLRGRELCLVVVDLRVALVSFCVNCPSHKCARGLWRHCLAGRGVTMSLCVGSDDTTCMGKGRCWLLLGSPSSSAWLRHRDVSARALQEQFVASSVIVTRREGGKQLVRVMASVSFATGKLSEGGHDPRQSDGRVTWFTWGEIPPSAESHGHKEGYSPGPGDCGNRPATTVPVLHLRAHHPRPGSDGQTSSSSSHWDDHGWAGVSPNPAGILPMTSAEWRLCIVLFKEII